MVGDAAAASDYWVEIGIVDRPKTPSVDRARTFCNKMYTHELAQIQMGVEL
jgi:hypothetical protein